MGHGISQRSEMRKNGRKKNIGKGVRLKQGNANERGQKLLWVSWHHIVNSWVEQSAAVSCHWPEMKAMWLGVEYSTGVNFREPTPVCRRELRQPLLACLNLRGEAGKLDFWSLDQATFLSEKKYFCWPLKGFFSVAVASHVQGKGFPKIRCNRT